MAEKSVSKKGCPCCVFLMDDLFLPPPVPGSEEATSDNTTLELPMEPAAAAEFIVEHSEGTTIIIDSHGHAQLDRDQDENYTVSINEQEGPIHLKSITCAVEPKDWDATLEYASRSDSILPALGVHPWYVESLPSDWLEELERLLLLHPSALVGEIGLCKMARFVRQHPEGKSVALSIQRDVFKKQMMLAAKLRRPVSVHCVNQHGVFVSVIKELMESQEPEETSVFPPAIAMHSFTGTAHHTKELLTLEKRISPGKPLFYFGFSHTVNFAMCTSEKSRRKGRDAVRAVPDDRLLVESDVHSSQDLLGGTAGAIAYVAWARDSDIMDIATTTSINGLAFITSQVSK